MVHRPMRLTRARAHASCCYCKVNPEIQLVYMTTHTIDESKYYGEWKTALEGYEARDPAFLETCKLKV